MRSSVSCPRTRSPTLSSVAWVEAVSQAGGFSPGTADRVGTAEGRRAFVKAVSTAHNPDTPGLNRREVGVLRSLA